VSGATAAQPALPGLGFRSWKFWGLKWHLDL